MTNSTGTNLLALHLMFLAPSACSITDVAGEVDAGSVGGGNTSTTSSNVGGSTGTIVGVTGGVSGADLGITGGAPGTGSQPSGTTSPQCAASSNKIDCEKSGCLAVIGSTTGDFTSNVVFLGCQPLGCGSALTCAYAPGQSNNDCYQFTNTCIPSGWIETNACAIPGCPRG
jgi:hypothetical protein